VSQGRAWDYVLFSIPYQPTPFVDDSQFLVGASRHYKGLYVTPMDFSFMTDPLFYFPLLDNGFIDDQGEYLRLRQWKESFNELYTVLWMLVRAVSFFFSVVCLPNSVTIQSKYDDPYQQRAWVKQGGVPLTQIIGGKVESALRLVFRPTHWVHKEDPDGVFHEFFEKEKRVPHKDCLRWSMWINLDDWGPLITLYTEQLKSWMALKTYKWHWSVFEVSKVQKLKEKTAYPMLVDYVLFKPHC